MPSRSNQQRIAFWIIAALLSGLWSVGVRAQELDSARQAYLVIAAFTGYGTASIGATSSFSLDTTADVKYALNDGLRRVSEDMPFTVIDTVTIAANTFLYTLNTNFKTDGHHAMPYRILAMSGDGKSVFGVPIKDFVEFNVITAAVNPISAARVENQTLYIAPASPAGYKLYVHGPGDITPISHGGTSLSPVPKKDRIAAVYWAVARIASWRGDRPLYDAAMIAYNQHVAAHWRTTPVAGGP